MTVIIILNSGIDQGKGYLINPVRKKSRNSSLKLTLGKQQMPLRFTLSATYHLWYLKNA